MSDTRNVWVFVEQDEGKIAEVSLELIAKGRELADQLGRSESNVSHHLSVLRAHGLVRFRRAGKQVF